jgi:RNA polymerase sigma factor (sigma-70 family)
MSEQFARSEVATCSVATLVHAAGDGNQEAWAELVRRFGGMIASVGRRYGLSQADIGELQQTTWLRLVENIHRLKQPERVGGWLATTASRQSLQLAKRSSRYSSGADHVLANLPDTSQPFDLELAPDSAECRALQRAWDQLKPRCRNLLSLLMTEEGVVGYKELSQLLDMPIGSIGPTRARCLEHLRHLLADEGITSYEG